MVAVTAHVPEETFGVITPVVRFTLQAAGVEVLKFSAPLPVPPEVVIATADPYPTLSGPVTYKGA